MICLVLETDVEISVAKKVAVWWYGGWTSSEQQRKEASDIEKH
jgi:hypothetical protein